MAIPQFNRVRIEISIINGETGSISSEAYEKEFAHLTNAIRYAVKIIAVIKTIIQL